MRLWPQQEGQTLTELQVHPRANTRRTKLCGSCLREDAWMLRCAFVVFRCACRVEQLGNLNISELVSRMRTSSATLRDERRSNKRVHWTPLKVMDKALMDSYRRSLSEHTKMPSIACAVSDCPLALFRRSVRVSFQLQVRTGQGQPRKMVVRTNCPIVPERRFCSV